MFSCFEMLFKSICAKSFSNEKFKEDIEKIKFSKSQKKCEYRKILDKVAIKIIYDEFENEKIIEEMMKLARVERIILTFHIILKMDLPEIAYLLDTNIDSIYTQKSTALKRLKKELENAV